jgi:hypothetical protein
MNINAWKTTFIGINKPAKVVSGTADSFAPAALWPHANGEADPYWSGGINPQPYRWTVTFSVTEGFHGSHLTRTPFRFNANDIDVGDFVAGAEDGKVCEIMSILAKDDFTLTAIVEDRLRYNTFRSATGDGLFTCPGNVIFFQINELGYPMIDPVPSTASSTFADNVLSRFQYMNPLTNYVLEKPNHNFEQGDAICIESEDFVLSTANNVNKFIGTVVYPGPGPDQFILRPANGIIDFVPNLPGVVGDYVYPSIDGTGDLTAGDESRRPIFMKIAPAIPTYSIGTNTDTQGVEGDVININGLEIVLNEATLDQAIDIINAGTGVHKITASKVNAPTSITSDGAELALGVIAGVVPFTANINGVDVNFTTTTNGNITFGDPTYADVNDMKNDINSASIENVIASVSSSGELVLTHIVGGSITIVNGTGNPFAGEASASGLSLSVPANTTTFVLKLIDSNGGPMTLRDIQGQFFTNAGVISGQNGRYAIGLNIEQGIRSSGTTVVANMASRDALNALVGDQCYVINDGNGEWATFTYDGSQWTKVGGQRAVAVDARTITETIDLPGTTITIGTVSEDRRVMNVSVTVLEDLMDAPDFTVDIGEETLWQFSQHGAPFAGVYSVESDWMTLNREDIVINIPSNTASGSVKVEVTYI